MIKIENENPPLERSEKERAEPALPPFVPFRQEGPIAAIRPPSEWTGEEAALLAKVTKVAQPILPPLNRELVEQLLAIKGDHQAINSRNLLLSKIYERLPSDLQNLVTEHIPFLMLSKKGRLEIPVKELLANEDQRILVAKHCAQEAVWEVAEFIQSFGITDQEARIEIAKLCAKQDGRATAEYIQNFEITDQEALVAIAQWCAEQDGYTTAWFIRKFKITDQKALIEIAKLCAKQSGEGTAQSIEKFKIADQEARIEIAKLCGAHSQKVGRGVNLKSS